MTQITAGIKSIAHLLNFLLVRPFLVLFWGLMNRCLNCGAKNFWIKSFIPEYRQEIVCTQCGRSRI